MIRRFLTKETWGFILLSILCVVVLFTFVDLTPHVDYDVFFSKEDPNYKSDIEISRMFIRNDEQIIVNIVGDIHSPQYKNKIKLFGDLLLDQEHVLDVKSIMHGPKSVKHAINSPFWQRLLISDTQNSSNIIAMIEPNLPPDKLPQLIPKFEGLQEIFDNQEFNVNISGFPYIVDLIRRHLNRDLRLFSSLAFIVFGLVVLLVFHSARIFVGMVVSCVSAACITLMLTNLLDVKIGILTANLTTIVFVLTLSHIVFLTFNWKNLYPAIDRIKAAHDAIAMTLPASFWAMFTTLLGFISLLYVQAKPIRELGIAGAMGTIVAFLMAYCVFPAFLRMHIPKHERRDDKIANIYKRLFNFADSNRWISITIICVLVVVTLPHLKNLNLDPSLISFFNKKSEITKGLRAIDSRGGSNPLVIVVNDNEGNPVHKKDSLKKLWAFQRDLEAHKDVGIVLSVAPLLDEAKKASIFSFLFSNKSLLKEMDSEKYGRITSGFVSEDRLNALFLMRMNEEGREKHRLKIIEELKVKARNNGLNPVLVGGVYSLQGHLSRHVAISLIFGLARLILVFAVIALITSKRFRSSFAMTFSICLIPLGILGSIAAFRIPLDIIAAPAANIAISMGIDAMIHMVHAFNRLAKEHPDHENIWHLVRQKLWEPIVTSMLIISCGFAIFFFSSFPPTQRFGGSIVLGTILAAGCALFIFPLLSSPRPRRFKGRGKKHRLDEVLEAQSSKSSSDANLN